MPSLERDYSNYYDDWLRDTGGDPTYGQPEPPPPGIPVPAGGADPNAWLYDPNATPPIAAPGGKEWYWNGSQWTVRSVQGTPNPTPTGTGGMSEADGRAYDDQHGLVGGYMGPNGWVHGSPRSTGGGGNPTLQFGGGPQLRPLSDLWPMWSPPTFQGMSFAPPPEPFAYPEFSYEDFVAPTPDEAEAEPGYAFAATQGRKQVEATKAAQGVYRSGQTLKDIYAWASEYAKQNYGGAFDRKLQAYGTNRGNAFGAWQANRDHAADAYMMNYGVSRDVFDRNYGSSRDVHDRNYSSYLGGFDQQRRRAELEFARDWDLYQSDLDTKRFLIGAGAD